LAKKKRKRRRRAPASPPAEPGGEAGKEAGPATASAAQVRGSSASRRRSADGPPPAPWGSFPLAELVVLTGIVLLVAGFLTAGNRGTVMILTGLALASLGGLEVAIREHFSGYRSHTLVLAGLVAIVCLGLLFFAAPSLLSPGLRIVVAAAAFGLAAWALTTAFRRASGGLAFRIRGFRG
jgi:hypothetical protein